MRKGPWKDRLNSIRDCIAYEMYSVNSLAACRQFPELARALEPAPRGRACPYSRSALVSWELFRASGPGKGRTVQPGTGLAVSMLGSVMQFSL